MANTSYVNSEPEALVARFSQVNERRQKSELPSQEYAQLRLDLVAEGKRKTCEREDEIQRLEAQFSPARPEDMVLFDKSKQQLLQSMKSFQNLFSERLQTAFSPRSWAEVDLAVSKVQAQWDLKKKTHAGRAKEWIRKMCNGMNNHSTALKMLPSDSEYVSLVAGAVTMIIKAAANHIKITESFAKGIVDINDAVSMIQKSQVYHTPILEQLAMRLYAHVFSYLTKFMTWFTNRSLARFLKSFNEDAYDTFQDDLREIRHKSSLLCQQIQLHMSADVKIAKLRLEHMNENINYLVELHEDGVKQSRVRDRAYDDIFQAMLHSKFEMPRSEIEERQRKLMVEYWEKLRCGVAGEAINGLLEQEAIRETSARRLPEARNVAVRELEWNGMVDDTGGEFITPSVEQIQQRGADVKFISRGLEDYFEWEHVYPFSELPGPLLADTAFVARLNSFTTMMKSQILYAHGQYQPEGSNLLRQSAAGYISLAREARVPVVSYFCRLSNQAPTGSRTREAEELIALQYAIIRQLIDLLPAEFACSSPAFHEARFSSLDGTLQTWEQATTLFVDVARCVNLPLLLFVIDGLNLVDDDFEHSTDREVGRLVACFKDLAGSGKNSQCIVKVLFTTAGLSGMLCRGLDEKDQITCDTSSPAGAARSRRGRQAITFR